MKRFLIVTGLCSILSPIGFAQLSVEPILVKQSAPTANGTNIRVTIVNGKGLQRLSRVDLQARQNENDPWQTVKTWNRKHALLSGKRLALDYLPSNAQAFPEVLTRAHFQVRAQLITPGHSLPYAQADYVADYTALVQP